MYARITALERARGTLRAQLDEAKVELERREADAGALTARVQMQTGELMDLHGTIHRANEEFEIRQRDSDHTIAELSQALALTRAELQNASEHAESQTAEIAALEAQSTELATLRVRAIKSEKQVGLLEPQLRELIARTKRLEASLAGATAKEQTLHEHVSKVMEHASSVGERARRLEADLAKTIHHAVNLEDRLASATARERGLEEDLSKARQRAEQLERESAARENALRADAMAIAERAKQLSTELSEASHHVKQLEYDLAEATLKKHALQEEISKVRTKAEHLDADLTEASRYAKQRDGEFADSLKRAKQQLEDQINRALEQEAIIEARLSEERQSNEALQRSIAEIERRLIESQESYTAAQFENQRMATFINAVKSSRFWKLKSRLDGILGVFSGR
jgi:chromosome segregation ATPase